MTYTSEILGWYTGYIKAIIYYYPAQSFALSIASPSYGFRIISFATAFF